jgi:hypothetical protein
LAAAPPQPSKNASTRTSSRAAVNFGALLRRTIRE